MLGRKKSPKPPKNDPKPPKNDPKPTPPERTFDNFPAETFTNVTARGAEFLMEVGRGDERRWRRYEEELAAWRKRNPGCE